jgi:hypothetical protein
MQVRSYRVNSYSEFRIPPKPAFECRVNQSEVLPRPHRARNLRNLLVYTEPEKKHYVETIVRSLA